MNKNCCAVEDIFLQNDKILIKIWFFLRPYKRFFRTVAHMRISNYSTITYTKMNTDAELESKGVVFFQIFESESESHSIRFGARNQIRELDLKKKCIVSCNYFKVKKRSQSISLHCTYLELFIHWYKKVSYIQPFLKHSRKRILESESNNILR